MKDLVASEVVIALYMQKWHSEAILAASMLGIAERLAGGPLQVEELATALDVDAKALLRLLRGLASKGVFRQLPNHKFENTEISAALMAGAPGGAGELIRAMSLTSLGEVRSGYEKALHRSRISEQGRNGREPRDPPAVDHEYDTAMTAVANSQLDAIHEVVDFAEFHTVVDLGGGEGTLIASLLARNPDQHGVLFDLPRGLTGSEALLRRAGVRERCEVCAGDLRETIPGAADAYILKNVLHGYDDAFCQDLLGRVRRRARGGAHLFIIEFVMPAGAPSATHTAFDLYLLSGGGDARMRTESEFRALLGRAGFDVVRILPTRRLVFVIDARAQCGIGEDRC